MPYSKRFKYLVTGFKKPKSTVYKKNKQSNQIINEDVQINKLEASDDACSVAQMVDVGNNDHIHMEMDVDIDVVSESITRSTKQIKLNGKNPIVSPPKNRETILKQLASPKTVINSPQIPKTPAKQKPTTPISCGNTVSPTTSRLSQKSSNSQQRLSQKSSNSNVPISLNNASSPNIQANMLSKKKFTTDVFYKQPSVKPKSLVFAKHSHALIQWLEGESFSVVAVKDIMIDNLDNIELDAVYDIRYGSDLYKGVVKILDNHESCNKQLKLLSEYESSEPTTTKVNKVRAIETDRSFNELIEVKSELEMVKKKIVERDSLMNQQTIQIQDLEKQLEEQRCLNDSYKETFCPDMIERFINMSKQFIQIFGTENDLNDLEFMQNGDTYTFLTSRYKSVKVSKQFKMEMDSMLRNTGNSDTSIFRRIIQTLIPDEETWFNGNREKLFLNYNDIIYATFTNVSSVRTCFSFSDCKGLIRQICNESRRKIKKKMNDSIKSNEIQMDQEENVDLLDSDGNTDEASDNDGNTDDASDCDGNTDDAFVLNVSEDSNDSDSEQFNEIEQ